MSKIHKRIKSNGRKRAFKVYASVQGTSTMENEEKRLAFKYPWLPTGNSIER